MALVVSRALQVVVKGVNHGEPWANVIGVRGPASFLIDQTVADSIGQAVVDGYLEIRPFANFSWSVASVEVRDLRTATSPAWDMTLTPFFGQDAAQSLPPQLAVVASHSTGLRGRSYRGRTYISGWCEDSNDGDGTVNLGGRTAVLDCFAAMETSLAAASGGPYELAVISRKLLVATPIVSTTVDTEWDRQDRRKRV